MENSHLEAKYSDDIIYLFNIYQAGTRFKNAWTYNSLLRKKGKVNIIHIKLPSHTLSNYDDINVICINTIVSMDNSNDLVNSCIVNNVT